VTRIATCNGNDRLLLVSDCLGVFTSSQDYIYLFNILSLSLFESCDATLAGKPRFNLYNAEPNLFLCIVNLRNLEHLLRVRVKRHRLIYLLSMSGNKRWLRLNHSIWKWHHEIWYRISSRRWFSASLSGYHDAMKSRWIES
jgi:hypothetical protein